RDCHVTGVQSCALPICRIGPAGARAARLAVASLGAGHLDPGQLAALAVGLHRRPAQRLFVPAVQLLEREAGLSGVERAQDGSGEIGRAACRALDWAWEV